MNDAAELIFVSIASYRDAQLVHTVQDCLRKAEDPSRVRLGICWQHGEDETLPATLRDDDRIRILDVPWQGSRGACWARAQVMTLWQREPWFLQVDSHCRFRAGWDAYLIRTAQALAPAKVVLSTYATAFTPASSLRPDVPEWLEEAPLQIALQGFTPEGIPHMKPLSLRSSPQEQPSLAHQPRRARFLSAGFLFAPGSFVEEIPYDPGLYFVGEEAAMTVRAYTSGYDLFHPADTVIWHDYERREAVKHWDDHTEAARPGQAWGEHDLQSKARVVKLLAGEPLDAFNLGNVRTLAEYEAFAGISFGARKAQIYTMRADEPPNPPMPPAWEEQIYTWLVRLAFPAAAVREEAIADASLWYIGIHDALGNEIYRRDLTRVEVQALPAGQPQIVLVCELQSGSVPASWTVWPLTRSSGWLPKVEGRLGEGDYTILLGENFAGDDEENGSVPSW